MSEHWYTIIKSRYLDGGITPEMVAKYVPKLITQEECDEILELMK
jgi:hypothetical protein